jgi:hypothetical protein
MWQFDRQGNNTDGGGDMGKEGEGGGWFQSYGILHYYDIF